MEAISSYLVEKLGKVFLSVINDLLCGVQKCCLRIWKYQQARAELACIVCSIPVYVPFEL